MESYDKNGRKGRFSFPQNRKTTPLYEPVEDEINSDVLGSYTGTPEYDEHPQQDADDL